VIDNLKCGEEVVNRRVEEEGERAVTRRIGEGNEGGVVLKK